jgi:tRNA A37 threonylcarbamoyladenosine synthetase subunit TsaC/SUA5/YrdC
VDLTKETPVILRQGGLPAAEIERVLGIELSHPPAR